MIYWLRDLFKGVFALHKRVSCWFIYRHDWKCTHDQRENSSIRRCSRCKLAQELKQFDYWRSF